MDLNTQKDALHKMRDQYSGLLDTTQGADMAETPSEQSPVDSHVPTHDADIATETFERERDLAFDADYAGKIQQIDRALAKIDDGTYGICEIGGERIPDERLEAEPDALLCIEHAEQQESLAG